MDNAHPQIFISYARADGVHAADSVERLLTESGFAVWRDVRDLEPTADFSVEIERAIAASAAVVVCVTSSIALASSSFVRREILYAQAKGRPIIPIRFGSAEVPILISHLTWVEIRDATMSASRMAADELIRRLRRLPTEPAPATRPDRYAEYLGALYDDIVQQLNATVHTLLSLTALSTSTVAPPQPRVLPSSFLGLALASSSTQHEHRRGVDLGAGFRRARRPLVLHGSAGSGKTTMVTVAARDAVLARLEDPSQPLPVVARAAEWDADGPEPLTAWLSRSTRMLSAADVADALQDRNVVLFVDGLEELGPVRGSEQDAFDPRARLLDALPADLAVMVTCRSEALAGLGPQPSLLTAELLPVSDDDVSEYVAGIPALSSLLEVEPELREVARTPLNLGLLTFAVDRDPTAGLLRDQVATRAERQLQVVKLFVETRYEHELLNPSAAPRLSYNVLEAALGRLATHHASPFYRSMIDDASEPESADGSAIEAIAIQLDYLRRTTDEEVSFLHPLFDDYFATLHCRKYLGRQSSDGWDHRLFNRIAHLGNPSFLPDLTAMVRAGGFWPGEYGDEIAAALAGITERVTTERERSDAAAVLIRLLERGTLQPLGVFAVAKGLGGRPVSREMLDALAAMARKESAGGIEAIQVLVQLGDPGVDVLAQIAREGDSPLHSQILTYTAVRDRLGQRRPRRRRRGAS
jgi:hypothetical protein